MKAITFVTQKGGSGKSTLCISLAVAAQERGLSVCILEMDRQATISDWLDHRTADGPEVAQIDATQIDAVMERLRDSAYDYVFIDTPGVDSTGTLSAIRAGVDADVLVSDYLMPGMTGGQLISELRAAGNRIPALLVTGYAAAGEDVPGDVIRLSKPFRQTDLAARVDELLRQSPPGRPKLRAVE